MMMIELMMKKTSRAPSNKKVRLQIKKNVHVMSYQHEKNTRMGELFTWIDVSSLIAHPVSETADALIVYLFYDDDWTGWHR
jgi:hypothetical protein